MRIEITSPLPLGCGFGLSGASALVAAYAVNALLGLGKSESELAMIAHIAEVENRTGLGDVCAQYHGGCLVKLREGHPLDARQLPVQALPIFYKYFSPIRTSDVLENVEQRARINNAADEALRRLEIFTKSDTVDFSDYVGVAKAFAINSGLLTDTNVQRVIKEIETNRGVASMIMLGNAVFGTHSFEGAKETTLAKHRVKDIVNDRCPPKSSPLCIFEDSRRDDGWRRARNRFTSRSDRAWPRGSLRLPYRRENAVVRQRSDTRSGSDAPSGGGVPSSP